ncbi:MAG: BMC domain-containing protein [Ruminococcaceae bacterium]|nr:BMC domain-containing protein [Oscillospiraceae bacterium]MBQ3236506.1 BMC domain-containing protein [Oscillospiraceae bacterium]
MGVRMTREEFLEKVFQKKYEELKDKDLRIVRIKVKGKEISLAQLIGSSETRIYQNLALHIGTHAGEDHTGESIGLIHVTPEEAAIIVADIAMKSGNVEIGTLDRFNGSVVILGDRSNVRSALEGVIEFFEYKLKFTVCEITEV